MNVKHIFEEQWLKRVSLIQKNVHTDSEMSRCVSCLWLCLWDQSQSTASHQARLDLLKTFVKVTQGHCSQSEGVWALSDWGCALAWCVWHDGRRDARCPGGRRARRCRCPEACVLTPRTGAALWCRERVNVTKKRQSKVYWQYMAPLKLADA